MKRHAGVSNLAGNDKAGSDRTVQAEGDMMSPDRLVWLAVGLGAFVILYAIATIIG